MSEVIAGWYPDPAGDPNKLRYWDGTKWTDEYTSTQQSTQTQSESAPGAQQSASTSSPYASADYTRDAAGNVQVNVTMNGAHNTSYGVDYSANKTQTDNTLFLVAFIFSLLSTIALCWLIIPLAWLIPMTVHTYGIYKGRKPNRVGFAVCMLIFNSLVAGIVLLVATHDE